MTMMMMVMIMMMVMMIRIMMLIMMSKKHVECETRIDVNFVDGSKIKSNKIVQKEFKSW